MSEWNLRFSRIWTVLAMAELGEFEEGGGRAEQAAQLARARPEYGAHEQAWNAVGTGRLFLVKGDLERAIPALERTLPLCDTGGELAVYFTRTASSLGLAYALSGRIDDGVALLERAVAQGESIGFVYGHSLVVALLGEGYLLAGNVDAAFTSAERALGLARKNGERGWEAWILRLRGEIAARRSREEAAAYYVAALDLAQTLEMRPLVAHCHRGLGVVALEAGQPGDAEEHLSTARSMYEAMGMTFWSRKT